MLAYRSETKIGGAFAEPVRMEPPARIRKRHQIAKHQPRLTDGIKHPVTVRVVLIPKVEK